MLTVNQVKEKLSLAYVAYVAAICHCSFDEPRDDMDSIDVTLRSKGPFPEGSIIKTAVIEMQLKTTTSEKLSKVGKVFRFPLDKKNYDDLRAKSCTQRYLGVLVIPEIRDKWVNVKQKHLIARETMYIVDPKNWPDSENQESVTIDIDPKNKFNKKTLLELMTKASKG